MGLFSSNDSNDEIRHGDRVRVTYAGIEGIVVSVDNYNVMISYQNEKDEEIVKEFMKKDVKKI